MAEMAKTDQATQVAEKRQVPPLGLYVAKSRGSQTHDARHTDATTRRTKHTSSDTNGLLGANEQGNCRTGDFKERKITKHTG